MTEIGMKICFTKEQMQPEKMESVTEMARSQLQRKLDTDKLQIVGEEGIEDTITTCSVMDEEHLERVIVWDTVSA